VAQRRRYSDRDRTEALVALDANSGNVKRTALQLGIPHKTLDEWAKGRVHADVASDRIEKKEELADRLEALAHQIVGLLPGKLAMASVQQLATTLGIAVDKMQVLRGKPSTINQETIADPEKRKARIDELLAKRNGHDVEGRT
jgi:transposase-like protein